MARRKGEKERESRVFFVSFKFRIRIIVSSSMKNWGERREQKKLRA